MRRTLILCAGALLIAAPAAADEKARSDEDAQGRGFEKDKSREHGHGRPDKD